MASSPRLPRNGAVGFIDWLEPLVSIEQRCRDATDLIPLGDVILRIKHPVFMRIAGVSRKPQTNSMRLIRNLNADRWTRVGVVRKNPMDAFQCRQHLLGVFSRLSIDDDAVISGERVKSVHDFIVTEVFTGFGNNQCDQDRYREKQDAANRHANLSRSGRFRACSTDDERKPVPEKNGQRNDRYGEPGVTNDFECFHEMNALAPNDRPDRRWLRSAVERAENKKRRYRAAGQEIQAQQKSHDAHNT